MDLGAVIYPIVGTKLLIEFLTFIGKLALASLAMFIVIRLNCKYLAKLIAAKLRED